METKRVLKPKPMGWRRAIRRYLGVNPIRSGIQAAFLMLILWIGVEFHDFLEFHRHASPEDVLAGDGPMRPPGVEGFLPISGLIGLKDWIIRGALNDVHPAAVVLLLLFVALSWMLRKSFCSWICPVGALSEYLWKLGRFLFGRTLSPWRWLDISLRSLKYLLMFFFLYAVLWSMDGASIRSFIESPYNRVADVKMYDFFARISAFAAKALLVLALLSVLIKNFWCRYLCPYGALLGLFSRLSPTAIRRDPASCIECGKCAVACPSGLPVDCSVVVRSAECTGCLDCITVCPVTPALQVRTSSLGQTHSIPAFAAAVVLVFLLGVGLARITGHWQNSVTAEEYRYRLKEIDSPLYTHPGGRVAHGASE
ncbi:MAG: 4Fe-4S binding protein [Acidobacteria bacterium]|nr:4Fe-4S binding protein [Acidobacteriota bacterium]